MNTFRLKVLSVLSFASCLCPAAESKGDTIELRHTYYWEEFTLTKEAPVATDESYRLTAVRKNGEVELIRYPTSEHPELVIAKPMPKRMKTGERPPTIVVERFDFAKQSATIRELRVR
jgi:hypothetical protein